MDNRKRGASKRARARAHYEHETLMHKGAECILREPVRKVVNRGPTRKVINFLSERMGNFIGCESEIERDAFAVLEADPQVRAYHAQPETVFVNYSGVNHRYTPDILVEYVSGAVEMLEVKPDRKAEGDEIKLLVQAATDHYTSRGIHYRLWKETEIQAQPRLQNINRMLRYRNQAPTAAQKLEIAAAFDRARPGTFSELQAALGPDGDELMLLCAALHGVFVMDIECQPISGTTRVSPPAVSDQAAP